MSGADGPLVVVANQRAGGIEGLDEAVAVLRARAETTVVEVAALGELEAALAGLTAGTVVAAGGDGTLNMLVQHLWEPDRLHQVVLGHLPLGTGNDLARTVGLGRAGRSCGHSPVPTTASPRRRWLSPPAWGPASGWLGRCDPATRAPMAPGEAQGGAGAPRG